jgi:hypothetical protein
VLEDVKLELQSEPNDRTKPVSHWTEGFGLNETGIKVFEHIDWRQQLASSKWTGNCGMDRELWNAGLL